MGKMLENAMAKYGGMFLVLMVTFGLIGCQEEKKFDVTLYQNGKAVSEWIAIGKVTHSEGVFIFRAYPTGQEVQVSGSVVIAASDGSVKHGDCK
jgi:hypothetical protein